MQNQILYVFYSLLIYNFGCSLGIQYLFSRNGLRLPLYFMQPLTDNNSTLLILHSDISH